MKKEIILLLIEVTLILEWVLQKPINTVVSLVILVPSTIWLIIDIIKNGNRWKRKQL